MLIYNGIASLKKKQKAERPWMKLLQLSKLLRYLETTTNPVLFNKQEFAFSKALAFVNVC